MDIRVLKYFLAVAREGNITKAADAVHVTQPTLSRQLMDLEDELGTELLVRGKRQIVLTSSGILFQQRAQEIVALLEKTERDIAEHNNIVEGMVSIGCVETSASILLPDALEAFHSFYPKVKYQIYSGNGDDIRDKIDSGFVDAGILVEPVEIAKYEFIQLPFKDIWGVLMRKDDPLAKKAVLRVSEIAGMPFILSQRRIVANEIEGWFGKMSNKLNIIGYHNLLTNTTLLVERGICYAITLKGAYSIRPNEKLHFVPLSPERRAGHVMAWKKNRIFGQATSLFLEYIKNTFQE
jgi:DNA-binding transcriptional LysR family regulator